MSVAIFVWTVIDNGKLANLIARLVAIVVKKQFGYTHSSATSARGRLEDLVLVLFVMSTPAENRDYPQTNKL